MDFCVIELTDSFVTILACFGAQVILSLISGNPVKLALCLFDMSLTFFFEHFLSDTKRCFSSLQCHVPVNQSLLPRIPVHVYLETRITLGMQIVAEWFCSQISSSE